MNAIRLRRIGLKKTKIEANKLDNKSEQIVALTSRLRKNYETVQLIYRPTQIVECQWESHEQTGYELDENV